MAKSSLHRSPLGSWLSNDGLQGIIRVLDIESHRFGSSDIGVNMTSRRAAAFILIVLLLTSAFAFAEPTRIRDVIYGRKFGTALTMDVIKPEKPSGIGIAVMVSGGFTSDHAWTDSMFAGTNFKPMLDRGQTVFLVVHGSQPKYVVAEINQDIQRAIRFIRTSA